MNCRAGKGAHISGDLHRGSAVHADGRSQDGAGGDAVAGEVGVRDNQVIAVPHAGEREEELRGQGGGHPLERHFSRCPLWAGMEYGYARVIVSIKRARITAEVKSCFFSFTAASLLAATGNTIRTTYYGVLSLSDQRIYSLEPEAASSTSRSRLVLAQVFEVLAGEGRSKARRTVQRSKAPPCIAYRLPPEYR